MEINLLLWIHGSYFGETENFKYKGCEILKLGIYLNENATKGIPTIELLLTITFSWNLNFVGFQVEEPVPIINELC